jgi:flagellar biosynthesis protein FlhF
MKIKRFLAKNMREAIQLVREEQGPDAVILSNHRVNGGIEVVAAVDYDAALMQQALRHERAQRAEKAQFSAAADAEAAQLTPDAVAQAPKPAPAPATKNIPVRAAAPSPVRAQPRPATVIPPPVVAAPATIKDGEITQLREDVVGMRRLLEQQLSSFIWNDMKQRQPERVTALHVLGDLGLDPALAREIAGELPEKTSNERARFLPLGLLARRIPVCADDLVLKGGVIALVGPTGVGKTTTLAKLAARFGERQGTRDIALVTTDHYRIGAQEQLFTYGRLLGIPVYTADNAEQLSQVLGRLSDRKLVLIDTAGMSPRDRNLAAQFATLQGVSARVETLLVMAANSQAGDLDEVIRHFGKTPLAGCILTKMDEASRIGGALSVLIQHQLPLAYTTDGQRVPEDLQLARADRLVLRAMQLVRQSPAVMPDSTLAMQFSGMTHAHA